MYDSLWHQDQFFLKEGLILAMINWGNNSFDVGTIYRTIYIGKVIFKYTDCTLSNYERKDDL